MFKRMILFFVVAIFFTCFYLNAQDATNSTTNAILPYEFYVEVMRNSIPDLKINAAQVTNAENTLMSAKSIGDVDLTAQIGAVGGVESFGGVDGINANGVQAGLGLGSAIPYTGTRWNVALTHNSFFSGASANNISVFNPSVVVEVSQPLLRNFFGMLDRYPIKDAEYALSIANYQRRLNDISVMTTYQKLYYEWILYKKVVEYMVIIIEDAKTFQEQTRRRLVNGLVDNDTYQNAKRQTFLYEDSYNQYINTLEDIKENINYFIPLGNIEPDYNAWSSFLEVATNVRNIQRLPFSESVYGQIAHNEKIRAEYVLSAMKNNNLPNLELVGQVGISGTNDQGYFNSFGSLDNVDYFAGLKFSYPIGNRETKAQLENARNSLYAITAEYDRANKDYNVRMGSILNRFRSYEFLYTSKLEQIKAIESRMATQLIKVNQGRLELDDYIETRIELVQAQTEHLNLQYLIISTIFDYREILSIE